MLRVIKEIEDQTGNTRYYLTIEEDKQLLEAVNDKYTSDSSIFTKELYEDAKAGLLNSTIEAKVATDIRNHLKRFNKDVVDKLTLIFEEEQKRVLSDMASLEEVSELYNNELIILDSTQVKHLEKIGNNAESKSITYQDTGRFINNLKRSVDYIEESYTAMALKTAYITSMLGSYLKYIDEDVSSDTKKLLEDSITALNARVKPIPAPKPIEESDVEETVLVEEDIEPLTYDDYNKLVRKLHGFDFNDAIETIKDVTKIEEEVFKLYTNIVLSETNNYKDDELLGNISSTVLEVSYYRANTTPITKNLIWLLKTIKYIKG